MKHIGLILQGTLASIFKAFSRFLMCQLAVVLLGVTVAAPMAIAQPLQTLSAGTFSSSLAGVNLIASVEDKVKSDVDTVFGQGTSKKVEGSVQENMGKLQRQLDGSTNQVEGLSNQVEGRAKRDVGRVQGSTEKLRNDLQDAAENAVEDTSNSLRDLFR